MRTNAAGIALITRFEGLELKAYADPGTGGEPWTIGYGHTAAAGPPAVKPGMRITKAQALDILRRDLGSFEMHVARAVTADISANQFAALVSFCFNVGPGNFRSSSVLRSVNSGRFDAVPRRLALWTKAAGRVLPGLVKRRAAEAELFMAPDGLSLVALPGIPPPFAELAETREARGSIEPETGKSFGQSTTVWASAAGGAAGLWGWAKDALYQVSELGSLFDIKPVQMIAVAAVVVIGGSVFWVIRERLAKSRDDGV